LFIFFFTLILWLGIQQIALVSRWPFFDTPTLWVNWLPTFSLILTGMTMYLITQDILGEREQMLRFVHFWIFLSAAAGAFFIYIF
ncbi:MAG: hypothetical protein COW13_00285, partial [Candidatus Omnitrophica bacterium CG12_big_fil_rev_8_21_14_0_65_50_5]